MQLKRALKAAGSRKHVFVQGFHCPAARHLLQQLGRLCSQQESRNGALHRSMVCWQGFDTAMRFDVSPAGNPHSSTAEPRVSAAKHPRTPPSRGTPSQPATAAARSETTRLARGGGRMQAKVIAKPFEITQLCRMQRDRLQRHTRLGPCGNSVPRTLHPVPAPAGGQRGAAGFSRPLSSLMRCRCLPCSGKTVNSSV